MSDFAHHLASQSWTLYSIGMCFIMLRTFARWRQVRSFSRLAIDDWLMITAVPIFYTGLIVCLNAIARGGGSNLFPPEQLASFTQDEIDERIKGSKIVVVSEQCMLNVIWTLKACMLLTFSRVLTETSMMKWIQGATAWVAMGWIAVEITFFTACTPFTGYWAVPPPNAQCTTLQHYAIVQAIFNISSDLLLIAIPIPVIMSLSLPPKQKIGLVVLFSMGTFVIIAAILTKVYNLSDIYSTRYMLWYTREASVAVYVANFPGIWPLLRGNIKFLRETTTLYGSQGVRGDKRQKKKKAYMGYGSQQYYGELSSTGGTKSRQHSCGEGFTALPPLPIVPPCLPRPSLENFMRRSDNNKDDNGVTILAKELDSGESTLIALTRDASLDAEEKAIDTVNPWKCMRDIDVHVDTRVEVRYSRSDGPLMEIGQSLIVTCEGPEMQQLQQQEQQQKQQHQRRKGLGCVVESC